MSHISLPMLAAAIVTVALPATAQAHPKLVAASPAANATVAKTNKIVLRFNEKIFGQFSGVDLVMTGMPDMKDHPPMKMTGLTTVVGADGRSLVTTSRTPLAAGSYRLDWHIVGNDTHRIKGSYNFSVR